MAFLDKTTIKGKYFTKLCDFLTDNQGVIDAMWFRGLTFCGFISP